MSEMEHRKGRLHPQREQNESMEDCAMRLLKEEERKLYEGDDVLEIVRDELYEDYYIGKDNIYYIDCEYYENDDEIANAKLLPD